MTRARDTYASDDGRSLGNRDWSYFAQLPDGDESPADRSAPRLPWAAQRPMSAHERWDRTLGIPERDRTMWPAADTADDRDAIVADLLAIPEHEPITQHSPDALTSTLRVLAPRVHVASAAKQAQAISETASRFGINPSVLEHAAVEVGSLIAKTRRAPSSLGAGRRSLHALNGADIRRSVELYLARAALRDAATWSDPDLPRLWMLANAITNRVPASLVRGVPAQAERVGGSPGVERDDLVNWSGVRVAIAQMVATVDAAAEGQRWIRQSSARFDGALALGVLHLTQPRAAEQLVLDAPAHWHRERIGALLPETGPRRVTDLSDSALKAMCDRNGWLLGTSDERTMREIVERQIRRAASRPEGRAALASGDLAGFGDAVAHVTPSLEDLERHVWRYDPASLTVRQGRALLHAASAAALEQFAGQRIEPRADRSAAIIGRFPERVARIALRTRAVELDPHTVRPPVERELSLD